MKITHNREHCFLAVWVLQQYGNHPRIADADDENDDAENNDENEAMSAPLQKKSASLGTSRSCALSCLRGPRNAWRHVALQALREVLISRAHREIVKGGCTRPA